VKNKWSYILPYTFLVWTATIVSLPFVPTF